MKKPLVLMILDGFGIAGDEEPLDVFFGRGIFPLENPSPVFLDELLDNTKGFIT